MKSIKTGAATLALLALSQPQMAMAQECVQEADVTDGLVYAMPSILSAITSKCSDTLADNGYLARKGDALNKRYVAGASSAWPGAKRFFSHMAASRVDTGNSSDEMMLVMAAMPEESFKPFMNSMIGNLIDDKMKISDCKDVEDVMELLDPLPPQNLAGIGSFMLAKDERGKFNICPATSN